MLSKPKLVFFQWKNIGLSNLVVLHRQQHVKCLSEFFEVTVINENCDYQQICEQYQPDITFFESGVNYLRCQKLEIKNTHVYPEIPKLGFHNGDSWCEARAGFLSDMENWGIETFFTICTTTAEHTPEITENLFVWPNFIDSETYRDYGESKIIPILFNGHIHNLYPWRQIIYKTVSQFYPSLICPHPGYLSKDFPWRMLYGEKYARTINASWFVPTCGTVENEIVRKHFEIPACKSCLITEKTPSVEASGFVDMENCVFADESDILDKIDYLFQNPDKLETITNAGYELVHSRHTLKQRDQIFQWFQIYKKLKPNQRIVQTSPFEPLTIVEQSSGIKNSHIIGNGLVLEMIRQGDEKLSACKYKEAEALYLKCVNYIYWMPEPKLRLAICNLYKGDSETALYWITQPIKYTLEEYKALDPDPIEWAYFIISLLCHGKLDDAIKSAYQFPHIYHPILDRTRCVISLLNKEENQYTLPYLEKSKHRHSIHQLPNQSFDDWINDLCVMLRSCKQFDLEKTLRKTNYSEKEFKAQFEKTNKYTSQCVKDDKISSDKYYLNYPKFNLKKSIESKIKSFFFKGLRFLERKFGYFLPYELSEIKNDEFFLTIRKLAASDNIKSALLIGASNGESVTEAFLAGIRENQNQPIGFCMNILSSRFMQLQKRYKQVNIIKFYQISSYTTEFNNVIEEIKLKNNIDYFDLVVIDQQEFSVNFEINELLGAEFIIIDDTNQFYQYKIFHRLFIDTNYTLLSHNPSLRNGYAIFRKDNNHRHSPIARISLHM